MVCLGAVQFTLVLNAVALMGFGVFFSLGCDNHKVAGVTVPYPSAHRLTAFYNDLKGDMQRFFTKLIKK